jgi:hypothetical protein
VRPEQALRVQLWPNNSPQACVEIMVRTKDTLARETPLAAVTALCPRLTATSLNLPADLPFDRWRAIGQALAHAAGHLQWWIADWWAFGQHRYGERYQTAEEHLPFSAHTCETYASVARAFAETSRRLEVLTFTHHQLVAGRDPAQADELLAWCAEPVATGGKPRSTRALTARLMPRVEIKVTKVQLVEAERSKPRAVINMEDEARPAFSPPVRRETATYTVVEALEDGAERDEPEPDKPALSALAEWIASNLGRLDYAEALPVICDWLQSLSRERFVEAQATIAALSHPEAPAGDD